ncbi:hypothetical protein JNW88_26815 [Micromonospora sp. ATA32]|nr:hypothetical protein [Micromonospora sp. ATA32]
MYFAVQGMLPPALVPAGYHVSIQPAVDGGRAILDAAVPDDVLREYGQASPLPPVPGELDPAGRRRFVLDHLLGQVAAASSYLWLPPEELPAFVWELFAAGRPVVFVWTDPHDGERRERVVVAVWRGVPGARQE